MPLARVVVAHRKERPFVLALRDGPHDRHRLALTAREIEVHRLERAFRAGAIGQEELVVIDRP